MFDELTEKLEATFARLRGRGVLTEADIKEGMREVRRVRMRTGAVQWGIFRHGETGDKLVEMYVVPTWGEHLRQHTGRLIGHDRDIELRARALAQARPEVAHLLPPDSAD